jgi:hypothetical protein
MAKAIKKSKNRNTVIEAAQQNVISYKLNN